jgi:hypothetical protein
MVSLLKLARSSRTRTRVALLFLLRKGVIRPKSGSGLRAAMRTIQLHLVCPKVLE